MHLAVGFFDGVHVGHAKILAAADTVLTFREHPAKVFAPQRAPKLILTSEERLKALAEFGGGRRVVALDFNSTLAALTPHEFADYLRREFPTLEEVHCGANWTFGAGGTGTPELLRSLGIAVSVAPYALHAGAVVSSTRIREALAAGALEDVAAMLGREFTRRGTVLPGKGLGRQLGFPTINLQLTGDDILRRGVYAVRTPYGPAVANYGTAPTMGTRAWSAPLLELHLLPSASIPPTIQSSAEWHVTLCRFLRDERQYPTQDLLAEQVKKDIALAQNLLL